MSSARLGMPGRSLVTALGKQLQGPENAASAAAVDATEDVKEAGRGLLVGMGCGDWGGAEDGISSPDHPARRGWVADSVGAGGGAGRGRLALVASWAGANGGGWR